MFIGSKAKNKNLFCLFNTFHESVNWRETFRLAKKDCLGTRPMGFAWD